MIALISDKGWESLVVIVCVLSFAAVMVAINWPDRRD